MKKIEELTKEECQEFLVEMFDNPLIEFSRIIMDPDFSKDESYGIEYFITNELKPENKQKYIVSFSNPFLLKWFYKHDIDLTMPLETLKYDYTDMDETNSVLFEFAMGVNRVINEYAAGGIIKDRAVLQEMGPVFAEELNEIKGLQIELINKL